VVRRGSGEACCKAEAQERLSPSVVNQMKAPIEGGENGKSEMRHAKYMQFETYQFTGFLFTTDTRNDVVGKESNQVPFLDSIYLSTVHIKRDIPLSLISSNFHPFTYLVILSKNKVFQNVFPHHPPSTCCP